MKEKNVTLNITFRKCSDQNLNYNIDQLKPELEQSLVSDPSQSSLPHPPSPEQTTQGIEPNKKQHYTVPVFIDWTVTLCKKT